MDSRCGPDQGQESRRTRKCQAGKLVDLIIARKCRRPRKCQAGRAGQEARQYAGRPRGRPAAAGKPGKQARQWAGQAAGQPRPG